MEPAVTPYIEVRSNRSGRSCAYLVDTRVRVRDIYAASEVRGKTPAEIATSLPHLSLAQIHAALAYYFDNRQAILAEVEADQHFVRSMRSQLGPGPLELKLTGSEETDAIPS